MREIDAKEAKQEAEREEAWQRQLAEQEEKEKEAYAADIQQDRIELIRLKQGVIEESDRIHEETAEKVRLPIGKRIYNFFYHNKWWLGITTVLVLIFGYLAYQLLSKVKPDLAVLVLTDNTQLQSTDTQALQDYFAQFINDENGDGKKVVSLYCIPVTDDIIDMDYYTGDATKLTTELEMADAVLVLTDAKANDFIGADDIFVNLEELYPDDTHIRDTGYYLRYTDFAQKIGYNGLIDRDICLSLRTPIKTTYDSLEEMQENYDIANKVLQRIMEDLDGTEPPSDTESTTTETEE
jgi:hypothetical protein